MFQPLAQNSMRSKKNYLLELFKQSTILATPGINVNAETFKDLLRQKLHWCIIGILELTPTRYTPDSWVFQQDGPRVYGSATTLTFWCWDSCKHSVHDNRGLLHSLPNIGGLWVCPQGGSRRRTPPAVGEEGKSPPPPPTFFLYL